MKHTVLLLLLFAAASADLRTGRIKNRLILTGMTTGLLFQISGKGLTGIFEFGTGAVLPVIILFPLFALRMLGAGDIKLLGMAGGFLGVPLIIRCLILAFLWGALYSLFKLLMHRSLWCRLKYFSSYVSNCISSKKLIVYQQELTAAVHTVHFSVPVLLGTLCCIGGDL